MNAGKTDIPVGTRVRVTKVAFGDDGATDDIGVKGEITHPFPGYMIGSADKYIAGLYIEYPPHRAGQQMNLLRGDEFEIVTPVAAGFPIEFVRDMVIEALCRLGIHSSVARDGVKIEENFAQDNETETILRAIEVDAGWIRFTLAESMDMAATPRAISYQPSWSYPTPSFNRDNPPDVDIVEGGCCESPTVAIATAVAQCAKDIVDNACTDAQMKRDWENEQENAS